MLSYESTFLYIGHVEVTRLLLSYGASFSENNDGSTNLMFSSMGGIILLFIDVEVL